MNLLDGLTITVSTISIVSLLAYGVSMLRTRQRVWLGILATIFSTALFLAVGVGLHYVNQAADSLKTLNANKNLPPLPLDWGSNFSAEDRTRYSLGMARSEYLQRGTLREYIDVTGSRLSFAPNENERRTRQQYIENIESTKQLVEFANWGIYGLFLLYGFGVALGFSGWWQQLMALTLRSSGTAQKRAAP